MKYIFTAFVLLAMTVSPLYAANPRMRCEPRTIKIGQSFTISLPHVHGGELGVRAPGNKFYFIAFAPEEGIKPPVIGSEFQKLRKFKIDSASAVGLSSISKETIPQMIFHTPGKYRFIVSENLETEDDAGVNLICDVRLSK